MDAQVARVVMSDFEIELQLLLDAIYLKYHYDFRGYSFALDLVASIRICFIASVS